MRKKILMDVDFRRSLGRDEIVDMISKDGGAEVGCQFCSARYRFDGSELHELLGEMPAS